MIAKTSTEAQLTISFDDGLADRFRSIRDVVATGVYQRGLKRIAADLDVAPSNLSTQLSDDPSRNFSVDSLERYIERTGDTQVIYYLIDKFLNDGKTSTDAVLADLQRKMAEISSTVNILRAGK